jgi:hypothetical protein
MIDPLTCKNCYHSKEEHRYGYLECSHDSFYFKAEYIVFDSDRLVRPVPTRTIQVDICKCKSFQPFENICGNKIGLYIDKDIPDNTALIWSHKAPEMVKSPKRDG